MPGPEFIRTFPLLRTAADIELTKIEYVDAMGEDDKEERFVWIC